MKSGKSRKPSRKISRDVSRNPAAPAFDDSERAYHVDEIFDLQGNLGWEMMVDRIRRGDRIRGRSL